MNIKVIFTNWENSTKIFSFNINQYPSYKINENIELIKHGTFKLYRIISINHNITKLNKNIEHCINVYLV